MFDLLLRLIEEARVCRYAVTGSAAHCCNSQPVSRPGSLLCGSVPPADVFLSLDKKYQDVIADICLPLETLMAALH